MCTALVCGAQCSMPARLGPLTKPNLQRLQLNDRAMIRQICNVRPQDTVTTRSNELLVRLGIEDLDVILKERRLRWYGHVERANGAIKTAFDIQVGGKPGPGRPKMTWKQLARGIAESGSSRLSTLMIAVPGDLVWDLPCVQQASYLEGGPLMWMLPLYLHVNQKSDYDDILSTSHPDTSYQILSQLAFWFPEKFKIDFQESGHGGHLGTILAIINLQFSYKFSTKFWVSCPFCWEVHNWISKWGPWQPSWISSWNDFSHFWSTNHPCTYYQDSSELAF